MPKQQQQPNNSGLLYKTQTRWLFHCHIKIKIPVFCDESFFDDFFDLLSDIDRKYNSYSEGSYFDLINKNAGCFVDVDSNTVDILKQVMFLSGFFDGEYDITVMPLIRLWGFYKDDIRRIPDVNEINETKKKVDYRTIQINKNQVRINEGQEIITGSFIKAYAVDRLVDYMKIAGITDAVINAGGSTIKAINNVVHPSWRINVTNAGREGNYFELKLANACFSTSAQNKTYIEIDNKRYGHILSPVSGYPSENVQVGIISNDCFSGDIISTALFNQTLDGFEQKMKELNEIFPISGFLIDKDNNIRFANGFENYITT